MPTTRDLPPDLVSAFEGTYELLQEIGRGSMGDGSALSPADAAPILRDVALAAVESRRAGKALITPNPGRLT